MLGSPSVTRTVLFVDDEPLMRQAFSRIAGLKRPAWRITTAASVTEARQLLQTRDFDAVVADIMLSGPSGLCLLGEVRRNYPDTLRVVYSGVVEDFDDHEEVEHAHLVFAKPAPATHIIAALDDLLGCVPHTETRTLVAATRSAAPGSGRGT